MLNLDQAIDRAKQYGMKGIAITDHGGVHGLVEFYTKCTKNGIKPILGTEIYLTEDMNIKTRAELDANGYRRYHLILYAKNDIGLGNLYNIASAAGNEGNFDGKERIDLDYIRNNGLAEGIVCTTACIAGPVASWLHTSKKYKPDIQKAEQWAKDLKDTFDDLYIELGCNTMAVQRLVNNELMNIAKKYDIPLIISGDTHYLDKTDARIHEVLLCMSTNDVMRNPDRFKFPNDDAYLFKPEEVYDYCIDNSIPLEAMENTRKIVEMCNASPMPKTKKGLLPPYPVSEKYNEDSYLEELCFENLLELTKRKPIDYIKYANRLTYELDIIASKGYSGYFLILLDIIDFCKRDPKIFTPEFQDLWYNKKQYPKDIIMTGPGRGSAAGSIVAYLTSITKLDPIEHGLIFERFLNPEKDAFPDCKYSRVA
jgi:DNA polymerase-3 subunit alpha